jgi:hypothetical protein
VLYSDGVLLASQVINDTALSLDEQRTCADCKQCCFFSAVRCSGCLDHQSPIGCVEHHGKLCFHAADQKVLLCWRAPLQWKLDLSLPQHSAAIPEWCWALGDLSSLPQASQAGADKFELKRTGEAIAVVPHSKGAPVTTFVPPAAPVISAKSQSQPKRSHKKVIRTADVQIQTDVEPFTCDRCGHANNSMGSIGTQASGSGLDVKAHSGSVAKRSGPCVDHSRTSDAVLKEHQTVLAAVIARVSVLAFQKLDAEKMRSLLLELDGFDQTSAHSLCQKLMQHEVDSLGALAHLDWTDFADLDLTVAQKRLVLKGTAVRLEELAR